MSTIDQERVAESIEPEPWDNISRFRAQVMSNEEIVSRKGMISEVWKPLRQGSDIASLVVKPEKDGTLLIKLQK